MLHWRNSRLLNSRRSSIGLGTCSSQYTIATAQSTPRPPVNSTDGDVQPLSGPSLRANTINASAAPESTKPGTSKRPALPSR